MGVKLIQALAEGIALDRQATRSVEAGLDLEVLRNVTTVHVIVINTTAHAIVIVTAYAYGYAYAYAYAVVNAYAVMVMPMAGGATAYC